MDKELLRIVIIAVGITIIVGMILWSVIKSKKKRRINFRGSDDPLEKIDDSLKLDINNDDFDVIRVDEGYQPDPITLASEGGSRTGQKTVEKTQIQQQKVQPQPPETPVPQPVNKTNLPKIIQFSIVASADEGFNGKALADVFKLVGLEYGNMKIYERLDEQRRVDFAVASMVEPGIFPDKDLDSFYSPGIVFFIQPSELDNPLGIFNDFIQTIELLANELNGVKWDHNRQPLTEETIQAFRDDMAI